MKFKMSLQFWPRPLLSLIFLQTILAQGNPKVPGIIESLNTITQGHQDQWRRYQNNVLINTAILEDFSKVENIYFDSLFIKSIILYSPEAFIHLAQNDQCFFYSLLENNLLKGPNGEIENLVINVKFKDNDNLETRYTSKKNLLHFIHNKECFTNKDIIKLFVPKNVKETLNGLTYPVPSTKQECKNVFQEWQKNKYIPYLCGVSKKIQDGHRAEIIMESIEQIGLRERRELERQISNKKRYEDKVDFFKKNYLKNLCENIDHHKKFCATYINRNRWIWNKLINEDGQQYKIRLLCREYLQKERVTIQDLSLCAKKFQESRELCSIGIAKGHPALYPRSSCARTGFLLKISNLRTNYQDCPGKIDHTGMTNIFRIIQHLEGRELPIKEEECMYHVHSAFLDITNRAQSTTPWPMLICYKERVLRERKCFPYIPGYHSTHPMSENAVIASTLRYLIGMPSQEKCRFVDNKKFNPLLLEYQTGCHIVYDQKECTAIHCPKKIIYNTEEIKGIKYDGKITFSYFPNSLENSFMAFSNIVSRVYKKKNRSVRNFTELKSFLQDKDHIIHGVGCLEDILPRFFKKVSMNQCRPMPFILDGYFGRRRPFVSMRIAIDSINSPRVIKWVDLHNVVSTYQSLHPLKSWTMHVIH